MAKKFKRTLALTMVLCMLTSVLPMQVLAADSETTTETITDGNLTTEITTTTTTTTDEETGNVTVTVEIQQNTSGETEDGAIIESESSDVSTTVSDSEGTVIESASTSETTTTTTTVEADGTITEQTVTDGSEKKEWTEDVQPGEEVPDVNAKLEAGETVKTKESETTVEGEIDSEEGQTTTTVDRTVTTTTSEVEVTINDSNTGLVEDQEIVLNGPAPVYDVDENGNKIDKGGMFDKQYNSGLNSKYADPDSWTGENAMPDDADLRFLGTGEHTTYYASVAYVIYEKDAEGNTVYDENGEPIIKELWRYSPDNSKTQQLTINGKPATELPDDVSGLPEYDNSKNVGANRPTLHVLMDEYGNTVYGYCIDNMQGTRNGAWYKISNLEDCDYYASEDAENHVRNIVLNGYWGTTNVQKEDGTYEDGSVESIKQKITNAVNDGKLPVEVKVYEYGKDGKYVYDEEGNPKYSLVSVEDVLADLTAGEAMIATQAAIWSYSNGSIAAQNGQDGYLIIDPDALPNHISGASKSSEDILDGYGGARIDLLYNWLINLETEEESTVVINDKNFVEDMSITVHEKVADHTNNADDNKDNDVYNTDLNFKLSFIPGENDDLLVQITYTDLDGNDQKIVKRLAGKNAEGQSYEDIKPEADGSYVLKGLKLSENKNFAFDLRLEGTQYLENGVYVYESVAGRTHSQNFVGVASGERNVDVSMGVTISFDVDEEKNVVAQRVWHDESDPIVTPPEQENDGPVPMVFRLNNQNAQGNLQEIEEEPVPLASPAITGDGSVLWIALILLSAFGIAAVNLQDKKRRSETF